MAEPETGPNVPGGRKMVQKYTGPDVGSGIAAHGQTADGALRAAMEAGALRSAMEFAEMIVDTIRDGLLVLSLDLRVEAANESFYRMFGGTRDETEGRLVYELEGGLWSGPELRDLLERVLPERHRFKDCEVERGVGPDRQVFHLNGRQLNHHQMVLLAVVDVTEQVLAREALARTHQDLEERVQARTHQVRRLSEKLTIAEQEERERIALVLHDDLQQHLFGAAIALSLISEAGLSDEQETMFGRVRQAVEHGTKLARSLAGELSPSVLDSTSVGDAMRWLAERKQEMYGLEVTVEGDAAVSHRPSRFLVYNLVRELLFNVVKHAGTKRAHVVLGEADGHVVVRIEDSGSGFDLVSHAEDVDAGGFGLASVAERLEAVGGRFDISSAPGKGTRITLTIPNGT